MTTLLFVLVGFLTICAIFFAREIKKAPTIDDKEPFLRDEYSYRNS